MFPDRSRVACARAGAPGPRLSLLLLGLATCTAGCSSLGLPFGQRTAAPAVVAAPAVEAASPASTDESATATETATLMPGERADAGQGADSVLQPTAPKRYTVKRGDTLWGLANLFLRDPWLWPEIWYVNPQVANPHLIYPGDVLALAHGADGRPQIRVVQEGVARLNPRLRASTGDAPIATIPDEAIAAFLLHPSVLTSEQLRTAPHIVAFRDSHDGGGTGDEIYVSHLDAPKDARFSVVHVEDRLKDPETGAFLG